MFVIHSREPKSFREVYRQKVKEKEAFNHNFEHRCLGLSEIIIARIQIRI